MQVFNTQSVEHTEVGNIVIAQRKVLFNIRFSSYQTHVSKVKLGKLSGDLSAGNGFFQIFAVSIVDFGVDRQTLFHGYHIGMGDTHLGHDGDRLGVSTGLFSIDLGTVSLITGDVLGQFQQIIGGTDTQFPPGAVVEETVVAVGEVHKHPHVGEHHDQSLAALQNVDVLLHVDFIQLRTLHQSDLLKQLHLRSLEIRNLVQHAVIHFDLGIGIKSDQRTQFNTAVFVTADVVGQAAFHLNKPFDLLKGTERSDLTLIPHLFDQSIAILAVSKQFFSNGDRPLGGGDLKIDPHGIQHQILFGTAGTLLTQQQTVMSLLGIEKRQTEVQNAQGKVDVEVVDTAILALGVAVRSGSDSVDLLAAGSRRVVSAGKIIGNIQLRKHAQHFRGPHLFGNLFLKAENFQIKVVAHSKFDALIERKDFGFIQIAELGTLKMFDCVSDTIFLIFIKRFTAGEQQQSTCQKHKGFFAVDHDFVLLFCMI